MLALTLALLLTADPAARPRPADAPVVTRLTPTRTNAPPATAQVEPSRVATWVLGGAAAAALAVGVGLLVSGLSTQSQLSDGTPTPEGVVSPRRGSEAQAMNEAAALQLGGAGAAAVLGLSLGATALLLW